MASFQSLNFLKTSKFDVSAKQKYFLSISKLSRIELLPSDRSHIVSAYSTRSGRTNQVSFLET